jgi:phosphate transport system permease protein
MSSTSPTPALPPPPVGVQPSSLVHGSLPKWGPWAAYGAAAVLALIWRFAAGTNIVLAIVVAAAVAGAGVYGWSRAVEGARRAKDRVVTLVVSSAFAIAVVPLVSVVYETVANGLDRFDAQFFTEDVRNVVGAGGGGLHAIVGTLVITALTTVISVPIGIMCAVYIVEYGKGRLRQAIIFFVDVMTGIPSIVAGLFAFALFAIFMGPGIRLGVMGAVALSVLMIPIVVRSTEEMLKIVPNGLREASYALGVPKWRTITKVVLPTALAGIVTGVMVAVARVIGETAPLLITTGTFSTTNWNPFSGRMANLPVFAFNSYKHPGVPKAPYIERAWAAALTLIIIVMLLNLLARLLYRRFGKDVH